MKKILTAAAMWLAASCGSRQEDFTAAVVAAAKGDQLDLAAAVPAEWDRVYVFGPYTTDEKISYELGALWPGKPSMESRDDVTLLVFRSGDKLAGIAEVPRGGIDLSPLAKPGGHARSESTFSIDKASRAARLPQ